MNGLDWLTCNIFRWQSQNHPAHYAAKSSTLPPHIPVHVPNHGAHSNCPIQCAADGPVQFWQLLELFSWSRMFHLGGMEIFNIKKDTFQFVPRRGLKWEYYNLDKILDKGKPFMVEKNSI